MPIYLFSFRIFIEIQLTYNIYSRCVCVLVPQSYLPLCDPMGCVACQTPLSMEFFRQEYWSGLPFPAPSFRCTAH